MGNNKTMVKQMIKRASRHLWHPCSQMKDYETFKPLIIKRAQGAYLELAGGTKIIDAISSWWCKPLGHGHPQLRAALLRQARQFEHVILANTCNETIVALSEKLARMTAQTLTKVFYASDGSAAVEIALKMSLHARKICGEASTRHKIMALQNGYHGETMLALSVSDVGLYRQPYEDFLLTNKVSFLRDLPYVSSRHDPLWTDCSATWPAVATQLNQHAQNLTAVIIEPIVQGAGGMLIYSQDFLHRLRAWTEQHGVHLIADEIMTGFGRTGLPFACQHADIAPDFMCIGKGLTGGWLPMSAVLTANKIYDLFYDDFERGKSFLHSHTHSGNALAAAVALECLQIMDEENIYTRTATQLEPLLYQLMKEVAKQTGRITNVRGIGGMVAADLITDEPQQPKTRLGYKVFQEAVKLGAFLRPLGNTIYWLPPLNSDDEVLQQLQKITTQAIMLATMKNETR
jgi:adenosylmethionine---8-amino-7-oxononanoate aminotransferase